MRGKLKEMMGQRKKFEGEFVREGTKRGWDDEVLETILLKDIIDVESGEIVSNHLWFNKTSGFENANLTTGDFVEFEARVDFYSKGWVGAKAEKFGSFEEEKIDFKLSRPSKIKNLGKNLENQNKKEEKNESNSD